jgi:hypothetical protein
MAISIVGNVERDRTALGLDQLQHRLRIETGRHDVHTASLERTQRD